MTNSTKLTRDLRLSGFILSAVASLGLGVNVLFVHQKVDKDTGLIVLSGNEKLERGFIIGLIGLSVVAFLLILSSEIVERQ